MFFRQIYEKMVSLYTQKKQKLNPEEKEILDKLYNGNKLFNDQFRFNN